MRDSTSLEVHRFLALCRLLMIKHPRVGARMYSRAVGDLSGFQIGWNELRTPGLPTGWIHITPQGTGQHTRERPDIDEGQINVVRPPEDLATTSARSVLVALANALSDAGVAGTSAIVEAIDRAARRPIGPDPMVDLAIIRLLRRFADSEGVEAADRRALKALAETVVKFFQFEETGTRTANVLSAFLFVLINEYTNDSDDRTRCQLSQLEYMADTVYRLEKERWHLEFNAFQAATYGAAMLADTVVLYGRTLAESSHSTHVRDRASKLARYIDELLVYSLLQAFTEPIRVFPATKEELGARRATAPAVLSRYLGEEPEATCTVLQLWERLLNRSAVNRRSAVPDLLHGGGILAGDVLEVLS